MKKILFVCVALALMMPISAVASPISVQDVQVECTTSEIDDLLTELDASVDEYVALAPKAQSGDTDATLKLAKVSVQISKLAEKLADNKGVMTEAQVVRYTSILMKMSNALK